MSLTSTPAVTAMLIQASAETQGDAWAALEELKACAQSGTGIVNTAAYNTLRRFIASSGLAQPVTSAAPVAQPTGKLKFPGIVSPAPAPSEEALAAAAKLLGFFSPDERNEAQKIFKVYAPVAPASQIAEPADSETAQMLADALLMFVGDNALHSLCRHSGVDPIGRVKGTWSAVAEINARSAMAIYEEGKTAPVTPAVAPAVPEAGCDQDTITNILAWVDSRIEAEVTHRPDVNVHKERLAATWGQMRVHLLSLRDIAAMQATGAAT